MDELAFHSDLQHEGRSAGLAFAYLTHAYRNSGDNRLAPYIAWFGSLDGGDILGPVSNIETKIQIARENGIRIAVLPEANRAQIEEISDIQLITYPTMSLRKVIGKITASICQIHGNCLGPKEIEYWDTFIAESKRQHEPTLKRTKRNAKYDPDKYVSRGKTESDFESFIQNPDTNCMVIAGESGTGKTYLLCNLCDRSIRDGNIVLFFDGMSLNSDSVLMESIGRLKPADLNVDSDKFITIVNNTAEWKGRYFMISLDAINEATRIGPENAVNAIEDLLLMLQNNPSKRVRIFLTCGNEMWKKLLTESGLKLSEDKYYGSTESGAYVPLETFTIDETREALDIYFGEQAKNLSEDSKERLRDPFMLRLTKDVYGDGELPSDIFSWDLFDKYYEKYIPDVLGDDRLRLINLIAEEMLSQGKNSIPRYDTGNAELYGLIKSDAFNRLVTDRVLMRNETHVRFLHDRFTEIHLAKLLIRQEAEKLTRTFAAECLEKAKQFPHLWGTLKTVMVKKWDPDLIMELIYEEDQEINEFIIAAIIAVGRENKENAAQIVTRIKESGLKGVKRLVLDVAYHLQDMESLREALYEADDEVSATATQYIYLISQNEISKAVDVLRDICQDINFMGLLLRRGRKGVQAALSLFLLILADHFGNQEVRKSLSGIAREVIKQILSGKKAVLIKIVFSTAIKITSRMASFAKQEDMDPTFNPIELKHFFTLKSSEKNALLELLPYFKCEKTDIETVADLIVEITKRRDAISGVYVMNVISAQATINGQWKKLIPIVRRIYDEGNDYSKCTTAVWSAQEILSALYLAGYSNIDEAFEFYREIVESAIDETKGKFTSSVRRYNFPTLFEFYQRKLWFYNSRDMDLVGKYVDRAIEQKHEDVEFVCWVLRNLTDIAIVDNFRVVQSEIHRLIAGVGEVIIDDVVKALVNLKIYYPEAVEDLLYSINSDTLKEHQLDVRNTKSRSVEIITRQLGMACGKLVKHLVHGQEIRDFYAEGWASAVRSKNFGQWIEQVFIRIINYVMGSEIYKEMPIDE